eukprot:m.179698 g.179698  ORF g.179698 m.179698 type:complete len:353 (+) comp39227_c1_seq2:853-1911(+)
MMLLSATFPPWLETLVRQDVGIRQNCEKVALPLDRQNIFYAVKKKQGLPIDMKHLIHAVKCSSQSEEVPKTLIFCLWKETCYQIFAHFGTCIGLEDDHKRQWIGVYHASMSDEAKQLKHSYFKDGKIRILIATSAFGMGVDISDITFVLMYGVPQNGLMFSQISGRGARSSDLKCVCLLMFNKGEVSEADEHIKVVCSEEECIRLTLIKEILLSSETCTVASNDCCSVCSEGVIPDVLRCIDVPARATVRKTPVAKRSKFCITVHHKQAVKKELLSLRDVVGENRFYMRGLDAILPVCLIDKIVKNLSAIQTVSDLLDLSVPTEFANGVFDTICKILPRTVARKSLSDVSNK